MPRNPGMAVETVKARVRQRDSLRCVACDRTNAEHEARWNCRLCVHRIDRRGPYVPDNCATLCRMCISGHHHEPLFLMLFWEWVLRERAVRAASAADRTASVAKLAQAIGCTLDELAGRTGDVAPPPPADAPEAGQGKKGKGRKAK